MKKIILAVFMMVVIMVSVANAEVSGSFSTKMVGKYVANNGFVLYDKAVQQTDLFILLPKEFYADLWISLPWDGKENFGKEVDGTLGWNGALGSTGLMADIGVSYFNYIGLAESKGDMINPFAKISKDFAVVENHTLTPYAKVEFPTPISDNNPKGGIYSYLGIQHTWQVSKTISIIQNAYTVYDDGAYELEKGWVGKYNVGANIQMGKGIALSPELSAFSPLTSMSDRKTEVVPAFGIIYNF